MKERDNQKLSLYVFLGIFLFCLNLFLIVAVQGVFIHTQKGPLDEETLKKVDLFENSEILDMYTMLEGAERGEQLRSPTFVLYRTNSNEVEIVRIEWNPILYRYGIDDETIKTVPQENGEVEVIMNNFLGKNSATVKDGSSILSVEEEGVIKDFRYYFMMYLTISVVMLVVEYIAFRLLFKKRKE